MLRYVPGSILSKDYTNVTGTTGTPRITYSADLLYMMGNISTFVNASWWLGLPFGDAADMSLDIMQLGEQVLGSRMLGFQLGNEPDLYAGRHRPKDYSVGDYYTEFAAAVAYVSCCVWPA
jgi:hypothetical protein